MRALHLCVALGLTGILASCSSSSSDTKSTKQTGTAEIVSFTATPEEVLEGDPTILAWNIKNAVQLRIQNEAGNTLYTANHAEGTFTVRPNHSQLYTLIVRGKNGKELEKQVAIRTHAGPRPEGSFKVEPEVAPVGSSITLSWDTKDATRVIIRAGEEIVFETDRRLSGGIDLVAEKPTVFTMTAFGPWGQWVVPAEVKVTPVIVSFSAGVGDPVAKGGETGVSWKTRGADALTLRTPEGQSWTVPADKIDIGSMVVPLGASGSFELVAKRGEFETVRGSEVAILGAPQIRSLEVSQPTVTQDEPRTVTVSWAVDFAQGGELTWGNGNRHKINWLDIGEGSLDITVSDPTDIRLVATNSEASASRMANIATIAAPMPRLITPRHVAGDEVFTLQWNAAGADHVALFRNGEQLDVAPNQIAGTVEQTVTGRTTYLLEAKNPVGSVRTTTVVVDVGSPQILTFAGERIRYGAGRPMAISWEATGGTRIQVFDEQGQGIAGCDESHVGIEGTCTIPAPTEFGTYTYRIEAENGVGLASRAFTFRVGEGASIDRFQADAPFVALGTDLTLHWLVLDDVDGTVPDITITDNRGGSWTFRGTNMDEGRLVLRAEESGPWNFDLTASVPGKEPLVASASAVAVGTPTVALGSSSPTYDADAAEPVLLEWTASNASHLELFRLGANGQPLGAPLFQTNDPAELTGGSFPVHVTQLEQGFLVIANNPVGESAEDTISLSAVGIPQRPAALSVSATQVAPGTAVTVDWNVWRRARRTTLAPFLDDAPIEITATAPFINVRQSGNPLIVQNCGTTFTDLSEGCKILNFPAGFTFPFDGLEMQGVMATANGNLSTTLSHSLGNMYSSESFPTAATNGRQYTQFGIFWRDTSVTAADPITWELKDGPEGRHLVVQYTNNSAGNTYQAVFWESGALDYRYATMVSTTSGNGSSTSIGWQDRDRTKGHNLNGTGRTAVTGGMANRSWRYFEKEMPNVGSRTFTIHRTTVFSLCGTTDFGRYCERRTVTVQ